jgi:predicted transcriptional regulator
MKPEAEVSMEQCKGMRRMMRDRDAYVTSMKPAGISHKNALRHVSGKCSHTHDVPPVEFDSYKSVDIGNKYCRKIRTELRNSDKRTKAISKLSEDIGTTPSTIYYHAKGDCSCDVNTDSVALHNYPHTKIDTEECKRMRDLYQNVLSLRGVGDKLNRHRKTVAHHVRAECEHPVTENIIREKHGETDVTVDECIYIRKKVIEQGNIQDAINNTDIDRNKTTVARHVHNKCSHNTKGKYENIVVGTPCKRMCNALRYLYYEEHMTWEEISELDFVYVSEETVRYHTSELCEH